MQATTILSSVSSSARAFSISVGTWPKPNPYKITREILTLPTSHTLITITLALLTTPCRASFAEERVATACFLSERLHSLCSPYSLRLAVPSKPWLSHTHDHNAYTYLYCSLV